MKRRKKYRLKTPGKILLFAVFAIAAFFTARTVWPYIRLYLGLGERYYKGSDFGIDDYISPLDTDGDGIDDQTDILNGARKYVATRPVYKSVYYSGGWPDDGYGVCTDVVANALKSAGYDLKKMVDDDIASAPDAYDPDCGDSNIDFRRVRNLLVYFKRHAKVLTNDLDEIGEWQGGDIVIFPGHIGIVSDRRNSDGVPLLIHHGGQNGEGCRQRPDYEEDILEAEEIVGHFRIT